MGDKRSNIRLIGLEYIQFAPLSPGGAFHTSVASFSTIGNVVPDSAHFIIDAPTETDIYIEEEETPDLQLLGTSRKRMEFALRDMGTSTLLYAFGGTTSTGIWSASTTDTVVRELCVFAQSKTINGKKLKIEIPRASVKASGDLMFAKTDTGTLAFVCDVLMPNSASAIPPFVITQV